jgi:hypothetical protein
MRLPAARVAVPADRVALPFSDQPTSWLADASSLTIAFARWFCAAHPELRDEGRERFQQ